MYRFSELTNQISIESSIFRNLGAGDDIVNDYLRQK